MNIFQISDLHYNPKNKYALDNIESILNHIKAQKIKADLLLVTGDIINRDYDNYQPVFDLIKSTNLPFLCITGNHDKSQNLIAALKKFYPSHPMGENPSKLDYVCDDFPWRFIGLDSYAANSAGGNISASQLSWLEEKIVESNRPVVILVHQFTLKTGLFFFDTQSRAPWCDKFNDIIKRHADKIKLVACGHLHNALISHISSVPVISCFSANWQAYLDFEKVPDMKENSRPVGYFIHRLIDNQLISYAVAV